MSNVFGGIAAILLALTLCFTGCYGCSKVQTSDGFRDSTFRKMSDTGLIWTTTEAEFLGDGLVKPSGGSVTAETFEYTIRDPEVKYALKACPPGTKVRVYYQQYAAAWRPAGRTAYFITKIERLP